MNLIRFEEEEDAKKKAAEMPDPLTEKFMKTRQIILSGEINKDLADKIVRQLSSILRTAIFTSLTPATLTTREKSGASPRT